MLISFISFTALRPRIRFLSCHQYTRCNWCRIHTPSNITRSLSRCTRFPARHTITTPRRRERYLRRNSQRSPHLNQPVRSNLSNKRPHRKPQHLVTRRRHAEKILSLLPSVPTARSCHHKYPPHRRSQIPPSRHKSHSHLTTLNRSISLRKGQQRPYAIRSSSHHVRRPPLQGRFIQSHPTITHSNGMQPNHSCTPFRRREKGFRR